LQDQCDVLIGISAIRIVRVFSVIGQRGRPFVEVAPWLEVYTSIMAVFWAPRKWDTVPSPVLGQRQL
jgi:hypothetical protein